MLMDIFCHLLQHDLFQCDIFLRAKMAVDGIALWDVKEVILIDFLSNGETMNSKGYIKELC